MTRGKIQKTTLFPISKTYGLGKKLSQHTASQQEPTIYIWSTAQPCIVQYYCRTESVWIFLLYLQEAFCCEMLEWMISCDWLSELLILFEPKVWIIVTFTALFVTKTLLITRHTTDWLSQGAVQMLFFYSQQWRFFAMTVEWLNVEKLKLTVENGLIFLKTSHLFRKRMLHWLLMFSEFTQASLHRKKGKKMI